MRMPASVAYSLPPATAPRRPRDGSRTVGSAGRRCAPPAMTSTKDKNASLSRIGCFQYNRFIRAAIRPYHPCSNVFAAARKLLAVVLTGVFGEEEDYAAAPGKWSIRQIVAHLADAEMVGAHRLRQVIAEDNPTLIAYNQDLWTANLDYAKRKPKTSLETFRRIRAENYELLKDQPPAAFDRTGNHTENGPMTLLKLLEVYAGHAESHARQLQEIRAAYKTAKGKK